MFCSLCRMFLEKETFKDIVEPGVSGDPLVWGKLVGYGVIRWFIFSVVLFSSTLE